MGIGDEGWFEEVNPSYSYASGFGINFTANLEISTIDFGTFHNYPEVSTCPIFLQIVYSLIHACANIVGA